MSCPACQREDRQVKAGFTPVGSQRYKCQVCGKKYVQDPKQPGYSQEIREQALRLYRQGSGIRRIGRKLKVNHQSVANWLNVYKTKPPAE